MSNFSVDETKNVISFWRERQRPIESRRDPIPARPAGGATLRFAPA